MNKEINNKPSVDQKVVTNYQLDGDVKNNKCAIETSKCNRISEEYFRNQKPKSVEPNLGEDNEENLNNQKNKVKNSQNKNPETPDIKLENPSQENLKDQNQKLKEKELHKTSGDSKNNTETPNLNFKENLKNAPLKLSNLKLLIQKNLKIKDTETPDSNLNKIDEHDKNCLSQKDVDIIFPAKEQSLIYLIDAAKEIPEKTINEIKNFKWKRVEDIFNRRDFPFSFYPEYKKIDTDDIVQGLIGNCHFLLALSAIAGKEKAFKKLFITKEKSSNGIYQVKFMLHGIPTIVPVDDSFPFYKDWFACASSGVSEFWVQVMEKAWAKVNQSYASSLARLPGEALEALTEAPVITYSHKNYSEENKNDLWEIIKDSLAKNYIVCTNSEDKPEFNKMGLNRYHGYRILKDYKEGDVKLLRIKNPWGQFEWKGDYSQNSLKGNAELFNKVKRENKIDEDDRIFYVTLEEFVKYFQHTFVCKYEENYNYDFLTVQQSNDNNMVPVKFIIELETKIVINLHQHGKYDGIKNYKAKMARILLAEFKRNKEDPKMSTYTYIKSASNDNDKLYIECDSLQPGEYHLFANVNLPDENSCNYTISTYAPTSESVKLEQITNEYIPDDYLFKILNSYYVNGKKYIDYKYDTKNSTSTSLDKEPIEHKTEKKKQTGPLKIKYSNKDDNTTGFQMAYFKNLNSKEDNSKPKNIIVVKSEMCYKEMTLFDCSENTSVFTNPIKEKDENFTGSIKFAVHPQKQNYLIWRLANNSSTKIFDIREINLDAVLNFEHDNHRFEFIVDTHVKSIKNKQGNKEGNKETESRETEKNNEKLVQEKEEKDNGETERNKEKEEDENCYHLEFENGVFVILNNNLNLIIDNFEVIFSKLENLTISEIMSSETLKFSRNKSIFSFKDDKCTFTVSQSPLKVGEHKFIRMEKTNKENDKCSFELAYTIKYKKPIDELDSTKKE